MDGIYLVTITNGTKLEGFDETLRPRRDYAAHIMQNKTASWKGKQFFSPQPVLAKKDDKRSLATSILSAAYPADLYWSDNVDCEQIRQSAKVKTEQVGFALLCVFI